MKTDSNYGISRQTAHDSWRVQITEGGIKHNRNFTDSHYGSERKALNAARKYRNNLLKHLNKIQQPGKDILNFTCKAGAITVRIHRSGTDAAKTFSLKKVGSAHAVVVKAIRYRAVMHSVALNEFRHIAS